MDFFSFFRKKQTPPSGSVAKDRLKLVLVHDRVNCSSQVLEMLKTDIIKVISNYMEIDTDELDIQMDLEACHCNGCPLRLADMEQADNFNLMHDVTGINAHLNHDTGKLERCFLPRFTDMERRSSRHD